ncbi:MAG: hypothetical protein TQ37_08360 [Candidatus Synechococcus spongiarum 15L]|uniref:Uncharacterized protein n=2 Tax=Candidatus Synechococcus spongiarum TaxID=431041 RepID=A0A1T1D1B0_9SYNE|nr:hypothetical protein [Candidatus Synechococcus spongiarum]KKZ10728.1 MAG: hypothetical protein TQ37_08360 [Candidatus Synechococcus spongiarum 15L]OOV34604.1 hypothetical protein BV53_05520 [Candidatus Synechococcus spongiarum LMB bulk15N]
MTTTEFLALLPLGDLIPPALVIGVMIFLHQKTGERLSVLEERFSGVKDGIKELKSDSDKRFTSLETQITELRQVLWDFVSKKLTTTN